MRRAVRAMLPSSISPSVPAAVTSQPRIRVLNAAEAAEHVRERRSWAELWRPDPPPPPKETATGGEPVAEEGR